MLRRGDQNTTLVQGQECFAIVDFRQLVGLNAFLVYIILSNAERSAQGKILFHPARFLSHDSHPDEIGVSVFAILFNLISSYYFKRES